MIENILANAIRSMSLVSFFYDGFPRTVEPYCLGRSERGLLLRGFQTAGGSAKGNVPGWHLFRVEKMLRLEVLPSTFAQVRPQYRRGDSAMTRGVVAEL